jgi:transketolase
MRDNFFRIVEDIVQKDRNVYLLTGNLGFKLFDRFKARFPGNFLDVGVAEPNMIGIAAGMSLSGKNVYCYSIIPFLLMRTYEQIRLDIACQDLNVKLIGVGGGFTYGLEGYTHFGIEDLALMRLLPNMHVVVPADAIEAELVARISYGFPHPLYIRLGKFGDPLVHEIKPHFEIGKGLVLKKGKEIAIFACGSMVYQAKQACDILLKKKVSVTLIDLHTLRPLDTVLIKKCAQSHRAIFSVEEHFVSGGLGTAISEVLSEAGYKGLFKRIGIPGQLKQVIGRTDYLRRIYGLTAEGIAEKILRTLKER